MKAQFKSVDEYIHGFPLNIQEILQKLRAAIQEAAPKAEETISYQMPAYKFHGVLVWFAAHQNHIGFYPKASAVEAFNAELAPYKSSKGAIQFPLDKPLPYDLVKRIVAFRVKENLQKKN